MLLKKFLTYCVLKMLFVYKMFNLLTIRISKEIAV